MSRTARRALLLIAFSVFAVTAEAQEKTWTLGPFVRPAGVNPVLSPDPGPTFDDPLRGETVRWQEMATFNPAAVVRDGRVHVLFRAEDMTGEMEIGGHTSRIGMAVSDDGLSFTRRPEPILYPADDEQRENEWPGGVEDPRIVESEDGRYILTYTQWNRRIPQLALATSTDLVSWEKHGPLFPELGHESKSGAILSRVEGDHLVAARVDGKYWMYWGVPAIYMATSDDLIHWEEVRNESGDLVRVLNPRPGFFDAWLVEAGPPAVLTDDGIVVLYNAGNSGEFGDPALRNRVYSAGQALFDRDNPMKLIDRTDHPFLKPEYPYERTGQYAAGTTFVEGLVPFQGRWFLYYGTADSRVGVAVWDPNSAAEDPAAAVDDPACDLVGAWAPVSLRFTDPDGTVRDVEIGDPPGLKILSDGHWVFVEEGSGDQGSTSAGGGTYHIEGATYVEHVEYHEASSFVGQDIAFDCRTEDDLWYQSGELPGGTYLEEVYRRLD